MITRRLLVAGATSAAVVGRANAALPGGHYLTPTSADDPIVTSDITSTMLYSTPILGESNAITVFDGTSFVIRHANQLALALSSSAHLANNIYPIFAGLTTNGPMIASGPAWQSAAYGASIVGSSAAVARDSVIGLMVNAAQMQLYNGGFFTAAAGTWRLVGGIRPYANGTLRKDVSAGTARRCDVWNLNHQGQKVKLIVTEPGHWFTGLDTSGAFNTICRNLNGDAACYGDIFSLFATRIEAAYLQVFFPATTNYDTGLRLNDEASSSGQQRWRGLIAVGGRRDAHTTLSSLTLEGLSGLQKIAPCEVIESYDPNGSQQLAEVWGGESSCRCTIEWMG